MNELTVESGANPVVNVTALGRLYVKGWDRPEVRARGGSEISLDQADNVVTATSQADLDVRVPHGASVLIESAQGDASVKGVHGSIEVTQAAASLTLRDITSASIGQVGTDLNAREISGKLHVQQVGRFANIRDVSGEFQADFISAHLNLKNIAGSAQADAGGNANLSISPVGSQQYRIKSGGVLTCRVPANLDAAVSMKSGGPIRVKAAGVSQTELEGSLSLTFGKGTSSVELTASGPISLTEITDRESSVDFDFEFPDLSELGSIPEEIMGQVSDTISSQMDMVRTQLSGLSSAFSTSGVSAEHMERFNQRTGDKLARAREKIERAQERAARRMEQTERRTRTHERHNLNIDFGKRRNPQPQGDPVSEEERILILTMLAEKKISLEEADALLAALEASQ